MLFTSIPRVVIKFSISSHLCSVPFVLFIVANAALFTLRGIVDFTFSECGCVCCSNLISCEPSTNCPPSLLKIRALGSAHFSCANFNAVVSGSVSGLMLMTQIPFASSNCILFVWFVVVKCCLLYTSPSPRD